MSTNRTSKATTPSILNNKRPSRDIKNAKVKYNVIKPTHKTTTTTPNSKQKTIDKKSIEKLNNNINTNNNVIDDDDDNKSIETNDTNVSDEVQATPAHRPNHFYQDIQNYECIQDVTVIFFPFFLMKSFFLFCIFLKIIFFSLLILFLFLTFIFSIHLHSFFTHLL